MKYSKIFNAKVISENQGPQIPRLVQYVNDEEINTKRKFLEWDILNATSVRLLFDNVISTNNSQSDDILKVQNDITQINDAITHISVSGGASVASAVSYDRTHSGLQALNVQSGIDELNSKINTNNTTLTNSLGDEITRAKASESYLDKSIKSIVLTGGGASVASAVIYDDDNTKLGSGNAQGVIEILDTKIKELKTLIDNFKSSGYTISLLEESQYSALTQYDKDTIYFVYEPINYTKVDKPANRIIIYDGSTYTLAPTDAYKVTGSGGSAIGVYTFTVTLNQGYMWSDSTLGNLTITYTIREKPTGWVFGNTFPIILN